jgi:hypothetical protein
MPLITSFPAEKNPGGILLPNGCTMSESDIQSISVVDKAFEGLLHRIMQNNKSDVIDILNNKETFTNNEKKNIVESALMIALKNGKYESFQAIIKWISDNPSDELLSLVKGCLSRELVDAVEGNDSVKFHEIIKTDMFNASDALTRVVHKENQRLHHPDRRMDTPPNRRYMILPLLKINSKDCQPNQKSVEEALNHAVRELDDEIIWAINRLDENRPQLAVYEEALKTATRSQYKDRDFTIAALKQIILPEKAKLAESDALAEKKRSEYIDWLVEESKKLIAKNSKPPADTKPANRSPKKKEDLAVRIVREAELHVHPIRDFNRYTFEYTDEDAPNYSQNKDVIHFLRSSQEKTPPKKLIGLRPGATDQPINVSAITENNDTTLSSIKKLPRKESKLYSDSQLTSWDAKSELRRTREGALYSVNANRLEKKMMEELADLGHLYQRLEIIKPFEPNEMNTETWVSKIKENNPKLDDALLKMQLDDSKRQFNTYLKDIADTEAMLQELSQRIENIQKTPPVDLDVLEDYIVLLNVERRRLAYSINMAEALLYIRSPEQKKEPPVARALPPSTSAEKADVRKIRVVKIPSQLGHQKSEASSSQSKYAIDAEVENFFSTPPAADLSKLTPVTETPKDPSLDDIVPAQGIDDQENANRLESSTPRFVPMPSPTPPIAPSQDDAALSTRLVDTTDEEVSAFTSTALVAGLPSRKPSPQFNSDSRMPSRSPVLVSPTETEPPLGSGNSLADARGSDSSGKKRPKDEIIRPQEDNASLIELAKPKLWRANMNGVMGSLRPLSKSANEKESLGRLYGFFQQCNVQSGKQKIYEAFCSIAGVDPYPIPVKKTMTEAEHSTQLAVPENSTPNSKLLLNINILNAMVAVVNEKQGFFSNKDLKDNKNKVLNEIILNYINADSDENATKALAEFVKVASQVREGMGEVADFGHTASMKVFIEHLGPEGIELLRGSGINPPQAIKQEFKIFKKKASDLREESLRKDSTMSEAQKYFKAPSK